MAYSQYVDAVTLATSPVPNSFVPSPPGTIVKPKGVVLGTDRLFINGGTVAAGNPQSALLVHGDDVINAGGACGLFTVASASPTGFAFVTGPGFTTFPATVQITPLRAPASAIPGPFIYDPVVGVAVTATRTVTTQALDKNHSYRMLDVVNASTFPDSEGWICIGFGTDLQQVVKYLGRYSPTSLILDYSYRFSVTAPIGTDVTFLAQRGPWVPAVPEEAGSFYLTAASAGRVAAQAAVDAAVAAGIVVVTTILYPGDVGLGRGDKIGIWGGDNYE